MFRCLAGFVLCFLLALMGASTVAAADCQFVLGFNTLRNLIGHEIVGECLENEHYNEISDSVQQTTGGLMVWRKADNWTAFTDGYRTWINGPNGLVMRLNTERFEWEADYAEVVLGIKPTPTPGAIVQSTAVPTPAPSTFAPIVRTFDSYNEHDSIVWEVAVLDVLQGQDLINRVGQLDSLPAGQEYIAIKLSVRIASHNELGNNVSAILAYTHCYMYLSYTSYGRRYCYRYEFGDPFSLLMGSEHASYHPRLSSQLGAIGLGAVYAEYGKSYSGWRAWIVRTGSPLTLTITEDFRQFGDTGRSATFQLR